MVSIRLARYGSKKRPYYHLVVTDSESPRDGKFIEAIGLYDPRRPVSEARIDLGRVEHWVGVGAQPSTRARKLVNEFRRVAPEAAKASA